MSKVLIDTSFLVSLFRKKDSNHKRAILNKNILIDNDCYITNGMVLELTTIIMMRTNNLKLTNMAYEYVRTNFTIVDEYNIKDYNDKVFGVFRKYNNKKFKVSFVDCSTVVVMDYYNLDKVVSFDKGFKLFDEVDLLELKELDE